MAEGALKTPETEARERLEAALASYPLLHSMDNDGIVLVRVRTADLRAVLSKPEGEGPEGCPCPYCNDTREWPKGYACAVCEAKGLCSSTPKPEGEAGVGEDWQDIATAPRDGTWFIAANTHEVRVVRWADRCDRLPINDCGRMWGSLPTRWMPLRAIEALSQSNRRLREAAEHALRRLRAISEAVPSWSSRETEHLLDAALTEER